MSNDVQIGGLGRLRILGAAATTAGMVMVGRDGEDHENRPELRWQNWPDQLKSIAEVTPAAP